jgi:hypothetical protein
MSWEQPKYNWDNYYEDNSELFTTPEVINETDEFEFENSADAELFDGEFDPFYFE